MTKTNKGERALSKSNPMIKSKYIYTSDAGIGWFGEINFTNSVLNKNI